MKKSVILALCGMLGFTGLIGANASACSNEELVKIKKIASNVSAHYEEVEEALDPSTYLTNEEVGEGPVYESFFKVLFSGIEEDVYVKIKNDYNDEVKFIRYKDVEDGIYSFEWKNTDKLTKFTYEVYSSAATSCPDEKLFTGYVVLPRYNDMAESVMCEGLDDFPACQKYITSNITPEEQKKQIIKHLEKINKEEENKNKKWNEKIGDFVSDHMVTTITCSIVVIAGVATVVVKNRRKRVK